MDRLVANRGKFVDELGRVLMTAQFFATHRDKDGDKLVLLENKPDATMRELTLSPDGQVVLRPTIIDRMMIRRGRMAAAVESYNNQGRGKLFDVYAL
jgi:hypothetical protein